MTLITTEFQSTIAEIVEVPTGDWKHPFLTTVKFIFSDNKGNANGQGIETEDFEEIVKSSIHMPIKMRYTHTGAGGHDFSIPIGHITKMTPQALADEDDTHQLLGEAVLYSEEYPDEVDYLKEAYDHGHAPGVSWELAYKEAVKKNGVDWLKGAVTRAATFVKLPAYGNRTTILSIAEQHQNDDDFMVALQNLVNTHASKEPVKLEKGGKNVEEDLEKIKKELEEALAKVAEFEAKVAESETKLTEANATIQTLTEENEGYKRASLVAERTAKVVEAGIKIDSDQEKLAKKQEVWLAMSPEIFDAYVADLAEASKPLPKDASASRKGDGLPKFTVAGAEQTIEDLKSIGRRASRGALADL